jgi:thioredoxin 1
MIEATEQSFPTEVEQAPGLVLVDFHAAWCGPCQQLRPLLEQFGQQRADLKVVGVDFDRAPNVAVKYGVRALPTLILFKDGKAVGQRVGNPGSMSELAQMVDGAHRPS